MDSSIELEIERVQRRVAPFEAEVADFFEHLLQEADPTTFASMAAQMPDPLSFADSERGSIAPDLRARCKQIMESGGRPRLAHLAQLSHPHSACLPGSCRERAPWRAQRLRARPRGGGLDFTERLSCYKEISSRASIGSRYRSPAS